MKKLPQHTLTALSVLASCDPRTVKKVINEEEVRGPARSRIQAILDRVRPFEEGADARLRAELDRQHGTVDDTVTDREKEATALWLDALGTVLDDMCSDEPYTRDELLVGMKRAVEMKI